jgi:hypothetical protein
MQAASGASLRHAIAVNSKSPAEPKLQRSSVHNHAVNGQELLGNIDADGDNAMEFPFHNRASADEISHFASRHLDAAPCHRADHSGRGSLFHSSEVE